MLLRFALGWLRHPLPHTHTNAALQLDAIRKIFEKHPSPRQEIETAFNLIPDWTDTLLDPLVNFKDLPMDIESLERLESSLFILLIATMHSQFLAGICIQKGAVPVVIHLISRLVSPRLIRRITRIPADAERTAILTLARATLVSCVKFLGSALASDGARNSIACAVKGNILLSIFRTANLYQSPSLEPRLTRLYTCLIRHITDYTVYPDILRAVSKSIARVHSLTLQDLINKNGDLWDAWLNLQALTLHRKVLRKFYYQTPQVVCGNSQVRFFPVVYYLNF